MAVESTNAGYILAAAYAANPVGVVTPDPSKHETQRGINSYILSALAGVAGDPANKTFQVGAGVLFVDYTVGTELLGLFGATPVVQQVHVIDPTGGGTVDAESRTAIIALNAMCAAYGLTAAA